MSEEREHSKYSPSQAERNFLCLGSTNLLARVPKRPPSVYAIEGTKAHEVLEAALTNGIRDARVAHKDWSTLFFEELDDGKNEFYFSIQMALDHVYSILDAFPDAIMYVERQVNPPVDNAPGEASGYCDVAIYVPSINTLYIIDFKHGAGVAKEPDCEQLKQYGAGFLFENGALVDVSKVDSVVLVIVQPRAFHKDGPIREIEATPYALWEYLERLDDMIGEAEDPRAPLNPGEVQCRFCDAAPLCPAREAQALQVISPMVKQIGDIREPSLPSPGSLDLNRLATIRAHSGTLRKWLDSIEKHCEELLRGGHHVPGAKLVETQARREWYGEPPDVARKVAAMLGERNADTAMTEMLALFQKYPALARIYRFDLIALTTAEKLVVEEYKRRVGRGRKKQAAEEARQAFAYLTLKQHSGTLTMVDEEDPRPAVNKAHNTFAQISGVISNIAE